MTSPFARPRQRVLPPHTGSHLVTVPEELAHLGARQHGILHRGQLRRHGLGLTHVRAAVAAKRWQLIGRTVVVMHNAGLTQRQREWAAVLLPGKPAALAGLSAAAAGGLRGFESDDVHIVVAHNTHARIPDWVRIHESRRFTPADIRRGAGPPRTSLARSVIDAATWSTSPRRACAILCASVQQRLTSPERLDVELGRAGAIRHTAILRQILGDISGGGHTLAEIDLTVLARRAGLPPPRRQVLRREPSGKARYVDAEVELPDGSILAIEIDGAVHLQTTSWWDDMARQNELTIGGQPVLRFPTPVIRLEPDTVVDQLRRIKAAHTPC